MSKDDRVYSTRVDEIHTFFRAKREWSNIKGKILVLHLGQVLLTVLGARIIEEHRSPFPDYCGP